MLPMSVPLLRPAAVLLVLAACQPAAEDLPLPEPPPEPGSSLMFLSGYRDPADPCRGVGESAETVEYLDDAADLVACPADMENLGVFVTETGGRRVGQVGPWALFSVPRR
jgi:hypothetical protein